MKINLLILILSVLCAASVVAQKKSGGTMAQEFTLGKIAQVAVTVKDLDRAVAFYRDTLDLKFLFKAPSIAGFDCAGLTLLLSLPEGETNAQHSSIVYFDVDDIQLAVKSLTEKGVSFVEKANKVGSLGTHDVWIAIFRDSEGNLMGLRSMKLSK
jgi:predicted enzyme related to lactoylglutathione lyase